MMKYAIFYNNTVQFSSFTFPFCATYSDKTSMLFTNSYGIQIRDMIRNNSYQVAGCSQTSLNPITIVKKYRIV